MRLNLGCSNAHVSGYLNVDICPPADIIADLARAPWVWEDSSIEFIRAHDVIEHLPNIVQTMNEIWRVLQPGGQAEIVIPTTDGRGAWQDPTHKVWLNRNSFFYFTHGDPHRERFRDNPSYAVKARFSVVSENTQRLPDEVVKLSIILKAVKP